ncbi:MAG: hypothetical protein Crog4KO_33320 [Crocinitomicaceae bacterium]
MDIALIKLSLERLLDKVEGLEKQNRKLKKRIQRLENSNPESSEVSESNQDTLIDTKEVLQILGVCYNTLRSIISKNLIAPIRINQRRVKYSKQEVMNYISSLRQQGTTVITS